MLTVVGDLARSTALAAAAYRNMAEAGRPQKLLRSAIAAATIRVPMARSRISLATRTY